MWSVELEKRRNPSISVGLISGPYAGAGFFIQLERADGIQFPLEKVACVEMLRAVLNTKKETGHIAKILWMVHFTVGVPLPASMKFRYSSTYHFKKPPGIRRGLFVINNILF